MLLQMDDALPRVLGSMLDDPTAALAAGPAAAWA
jgi:hypothetical protein